MKDIARQSKMLQQGKLMCSIWGLSIVPLRIFCKPETILKCKVYLKKSHLPSDNKQISKPLACQVFSLLMKIGPWENTCFSKKKVTLSTNSEAFLLFQQLLYFLICIILVPENIRWRISSFHVFSPLLSSWAWIFTFPYLNDLLPVFPHLLTWAML